jgi:hypothetical protein
MVLAMLKLEQANIRFCQQLGKSLSETLDLLHKVYGDYSFGHNTVFQWHHWLQTEWVLQKDDMQSSDPRTARTEKVCEVQHTVHTNCTHTVHDIATIVQTSHADRHSILRKNLILSRSVQYTIHCPLTEVQC